MLKFLPAFFLLAATAVFAAPPEPPVNSEISRLVDTSVLISEHEGYAFAAVQELDLVARARQGAAARLRAPSNATNI